MEHATGRSFLRDQRRKALMLPRYTLGEEITNGITHGLGAVLAVVGTVVLLIHAPKNALSIVSVSLYSASMVLLYCISTLYHALGVNRAKKVFQVLDHCTIYLLIAGSYTPVCLTALRGPWGWSMFGIIWALAIAGLVMTLVWINCPRWLTSTVYIAMGWLAVVAIYPLYLSLGISGVAWLLSGGILYTIGGVLYALKWPARDNPRFGCHEIFHVFIVLGSVAHYMMVYHVLLPL